MEGESVRMCSSYAWRIVQGLIYKCVITLGIAMVRDPRILQIKHTHMYIDTCVHYLWLYTYNYDNIRIQHIYINKRKRNIMLYTL